MEVRACRIKHLALARGEGRSEQEHTARPMPMKPTRPSLNTSRLPEGFRIDANRGWEARQEVARDGTSEG